MNFFDTMYFEFAAYYPWHETESFPKQFLHKTLVRIFFWESSKKHVFFSYFVLYFFSLKKRLCAFCVTGRRKISFPNAE
jgi:hypothetical protein